MVTKSRILVLGLVALVLLAACAAPAASPTTSSPAQTKPSALSGQINVGVSLVLTGPISAIGQMAQQGYQLAESDINASGMLGDAKLKLTFEDDAFNKDQVVTVFQKFVSNKVSAILGPIGSLIAPAALPVAQDAKIPVITLSVPDNDITNIGDYVFSNLPRYAERGVPYLVDTLLKAYPNIKTVALLTDKNYQSGVIAQKRMKEVWEQKGIKIGLDDTYLSTDQDFSAIIAKIKTVKPDLIAMNGALPADAFIAIQLRRDGINTPLVGSLATGTPSFINQAGASGEGVIAVVYWLPGAPGETARSAAFTKAFREKYSKEPDHYGAAAYDSTLLLATAIKQAQSADPKAIRDTLAGTTGVEGVFGKIGFNAKRELASPFTVITWKDGKVVPFKP